MVAEESKTNVFGLPVTEPLELEVEEVATLIQIPDELYQEYLETQRLLKYWQENPDKRPPPNKPLWQEHEDKYNSGAGLEVTHSGKYIIRGAYEGDIWLEPEHAVDMALAILKDARERFPNPAQ